MPRLKSSDIGFMCRVKKMKSEYGGVRPDAAPV
jgi:hypothetical protein